MSNSKNKFTSEYYICGWKQFIEECEDGYGWDYGEYINELSIRNGIEYYMQKKNDEEFEAKIRKLDEEFKSLLIPGASLKKYNSWWENGVLKYAGEGYAQFMKHNGFDVEIV
ncbi:hypothetical protein ACFODZ_17055 [Marinicella sediminis]|uniref:Uncharacterized protein n=1 Tax=Marinicella sediminis TaxID=1792834 RepID=A0ABV7JFD2_9GAMM|nr:hypothetical protein [Marinicella sediminis]